MQKIYPYNDTFSLKGLLPVNFILNFINVFNSFLLLFLCGKQKIVKRLLYANYTQQQSSRTSIIHLFILYF